MELKNRIEGDLKAAMLAGETARVTVLRGLKAVILDAEVAGGVRDKGLVDAEILKLLAREVKRRDEAIVMYEANGRSDLVQAERLEKEVISGYLPVQLSEEEIVAKIDEVLSCLGQEERANMGMVIGRVKGMVGAAADGAVVARLVRERLAG